MRAIAVFFVTFILSLTFLLYSYNAFLEHASMVVIALYLVGSGCVLGAAASWWQWAQDNYFAFMLASLSAAMTLLLPFVVNTYGYALRAFPLVLLWVAMNTVGLFGSIVFRGRSETS